MRAALPAAWRLGLLAVLPGPLPILGAAPGPPAVEPAWVRADRVLAMPVLRPIASRGEGLTLRRVLPGRGCLGEQLDAIYNGSGGQYLRIGEGRPGYCGNLGDAPLLARPRIDGVRGWLYDYGEGPHREDQPFTLVFHVRGVEITMISSRVGRARLLRLGRSMRPVSR